jgi:hypothetical protein
MLHVQPNGTATRLTGDSPGEVAALQAALAQPAAAPERSMHIMMPFS